MILKHLIEDLNSIITRANEYDPTNISSIEYSKGQVLFECGQEEVEELKSKLKDGEDTISGLESDLLNRDVAITLLESTISSLESELNNFVADKEGAALDLIARAKNAEISEKHCRNAVLNMSRSLGEITLENEKLRARKNKATVERCRITGKLVAEFDGVKYTLEQTK